MNEFTREVLNGQIKHLEQMIGVQRDNATRAREQLAEAEAKERDLRDRLAQLKADMPAS